MDFVLPTSTLPKLTVELLTGALPDGDGTLWRATRSSALRTHATEKSQSVSICFRFVFALLSFPL